MDDGVIKFSYQLISNDIKTNDHLTELINWRQKLFSENLIGIDIPSGVGFGNISQRQNNNIYISASQTGGLKTTTQDDYVHLLSWNFSPPQISYAGMKLPSSETLTHLAIFEENKKINWVFHFHHPKLWQWLIDHHYPSTSADVPYGTEGMSHEVRAIARQNDKGIIVLKGHQDGVITFGTAGEEAYQQIPRDLNEDKQAR